MTERKVYVCVWGDDEMFGLVVRIETSSDDDDNDDDEEKEERDLAWPSTGPFLLISNTKWRKKNR